MDDLGYRVAQGLTAGVVGLVAILALACSTYAAKAALRGRELRDALRRVRHWHLYAMRQRHMADRVVELNERFAAKIGELEGQLYEQTEEIRRVDRIREKAEDACLMKHLELVHALSDRDDARERLYAATMPGALDLELP